MDLLGDILGKMDAPPKPKAPMARIPKKARPSTLTAPETDIKKSKTEEKPRVKGDFERVAVNLFEIKFGLDNVSRLHVDILVVMENGKSWPANGQKKGVGDIGRTVRLTSLFNIFNQSLPKFENIVFTPGTLPIYDCGASAYVRSECLLVDEKVSNVIIMRADELNKKSALVAGSKLKHVEVTLKRDLDLCLQRMNKEDLQRVNSAIQFFDVLTSQSAYERDFINHKGKFFERKAGSSGGKGEERGSGGYDDRGGSSRRDDRGGSRYDSRGSGGYDNRSSSARRDVGGRYDDRSGGSNNQRGGPAGELVFQGQAKEIYDGFEKTIRMIDDKSTQSLVSPVISLDVKRSAFYQAKSLIDFLIEVGDLGRDRNRLERSLSTFLSSHRGSAVIDELKTLAVTTTHLPKQQNTFYIYDLSLDNTANSFEFMHNDQVVTTQQYYLMQYHINLRYPDLPMAVQRRQSGKSYFPLELLTIPEGQRVKPNKISPIMHQEMPKKLTMPPGKHLEYYRNIQKNMWSNDKYLRHYEVTIGQDLVKVDAHKLQPPAIKNQTRTTVPYGSLKYENKGQPFHRPAKIRKMLILAVSDVKVDLNAFKDSLLKSMRSYGIQCESNEIQHVEVNDFRKLKDIVKHTSADLIFVIQKNKTDEFHDELKFDERATGKQTIQISEDTARKFGGHQNSKTTVQNIMHKLNVKAGGLNFIVSVPPNPKIMSSDRYKLLDRTMTVGFELSHTKARCLFDQQNNIAAGEPSFVAMTYSVGSTTDHAGISWAQKPLQTHISNLENKFESALQVYQKKNRGASPQSIFIYRSGVGEGSFEFVRGEVEEIRRASSKVCRCDVKIVVVVLQVMCNYRLFKLNSSDNVDSGTCLVNNVTNGAYEEFVMASQVGRLGTSKPVRYTVLVNDLKLTTEEVAQFTYWNAFGHQVSCAPVSRPDIIFSAQMNAKRARANFLRNRYRVVAGNINRANLNAKDLDDTDLEVVTRAICNMNINHNFWQ